MEKEIWKSVVGFEGLYEVSDRGRVRKSCDSGRYKKGRILSFDLYKGYPRTRLSKFGKGYRFGIHQLVIRTFRGPCPKGKEISHLNDIKTDSRLSNLRYMTRSENVKLAFKNGRRSNKGNNHPMFGRHWSLKTRKRMSEARKEYYAKIQK